MVKVFVEKFDVSPWDRTHQVCLFTVALYICRFVSNTVREEKRECLKIMFLEYWTDAIFSCKEIYALYSVLEKCS